MTQAVRWGWVMTNVVAVAQLGNGSGSRGTLSEEEVRKVLAAAEELADSLVIEPATPSPSGWPPSPGPVGRSWRRCGGPTSTATD